MTLSTANADPPSTYSLPLCNSSTAEQIPFGVACVAEARRPTSPTATSAQCRLAKRDIQEQVQTDKLKTDRPPASEKASATKTPIALDGVAVNPSADPLSRVIQRITHKAADSKTENVIYAADNVKVLSSEGKASTGKSQNRKHCGPEALSSAVTPSGFYKRHAESSYTAEVNCASTSTAAESVTKTLSPFFLSPSYSLFAENGKSPRPAVALVVSSSSTPLNSRGANSDASAVCGNGPQYRMAASYDRRKSSIVDDCKEKLKQLNSESLTPQIAITSSEKVLGIAGNEGEKLQKISNNRFTAVCSQSEGNYESRNQSKQKQKVEKQLSSKAEYTYEFPEKEVEQNAMGGIEYKTSASESARLSWRSNSKNDVPTGADRKRKKQSYEAQPSWPPLHPSEATAEGSVGTVTRDDCEKRSVGLGTRRTRSDSNTLIVDNSMRNGSSEKCNASRQSKLAVTQTRSDSKCYYADDNKESTRVKYAVDTYPVGRWQPTRKIKKKKEKTETAEVSVEGISERMDRRRNKPKTDTGRASDNAESARQPYLGVITKIPSRRRSYAKLDSFTCVDIFIDGRSRKATGTVESTREEQKGERTKPRRDNVRRRTAPTFDKISCGQFDSESLTYTHCAAETAADHCPARVDINQNLTNEATTTVNNTNIIPPPTKSPETTEGNICVDTEKELLIAEPHHRARAGNYRRTGQADEVRSSSVRIKQLAEVENERKVSIGTCSYINVSKRHRDETAPRQRTLSLLSRSDSGDVGVQTITEEGMLNLANLVISLTEKSTIQRAKARRHACEFICIILRRITTRNVKRAFSNLNSHRFSVSPFYMSAFGTSLYSSENNPRLPLNIVVSRETNFTENAHPDATRCNGGDSKQVDNGVPCLTDSPGGKSLQTYHFRQSLDSAEDRQWRKVALGGVCGASSTTQPLYGNSHQSKAHHSSPSFSKSPNFRYNSESAVCLSSKVEGQLISFKKLRYKLDNLLVSATKESNFCS